MRNLMVAALCILVAGCDYEVALVEEPKEAIDRGAVGLWKEETADGPDRKLLVLPMSENEYLISYPAETRNSMYGRGAHLEVAGIELVQLRWFGTGEGKDADTERIYQYGSYSVNGDTLEFRLVNRDTVDKDAATPEELAESIAAQADNPDLFRKAIVFHRVEE